MYLGIDIGSVSIKLALIKNNLSLVSQNYLYTNGDVIQATKNILQKLKNQEVQGIGVTGSGRKFIKHLIKADLDIDEITAHRTAVAKLYPQVKTILEIGGQDSKLIHFSRKSINFEMNNVCAAGTGSFLDQQASRLNLSITDFYKKGLTTKDYYAIASKCTVFAESDMIHAQQSGIPLNKIIRGVHRGMINNYFSQLCRGKKLQGAFLFEGGTSENKLLVEELAQKLMQEKLIQKKSDLIIPKHNKIIGALGAAIFCAQQKIKNPRKLPKTLNYKFIKSENCQQCPSQCGAKTITFKINNQSITLGKSCQL